MIVNDPLLLRRVQHSAFCKLMSRGGRCVWGPLRGWQDSHLSISPCRFLPCLPQLLYLFVAQGKMGEKESDREHLVSKAMQQGVIYFRCHNIFSVLPLCLPLQASSGPHKKECSNTFFLFVCFQQVFGEVKSTSHAGQYPTASSCTKARQSFTIPCYSTKRSDVQT